MSKNQKYCNDIVQAEAFEIFSSSLNQKLLLLLLPHIKLLRICYKCVFKAAPL